MNLRSSGLVAGLALVLPCAASAQTTCAPEFVEAAQTVFVQDIVVGRQDLTIEPFQVRIRNGAQESARCSATIRVARLSISPSINPLRFTLQSQGQALEILPRETAPGSFRSDLRIAQLPTGRNGISLPFQLGIPTGWGAQSGRQIEDLLIQLVDDAGQVLDSLPLTIQIIIPPAAEVRVVGATGTDPVARIDLGDLDPEQLNVSERFGVRVWSTSAYTVRFESENGGALVHSEVRGRIPYELWMNQQRVSVAGAIAAQIPQGTNALGDFHPLQVQVRPFNARAGNYSDRVQVTVTAS
ncbi:MAG: hypothetical protein GW854_13535 [Erythrobacter sp.]|nr:hypothetical protein [Erythrobacter sp.]NCQ22390.1 hypothetical protein [Sphingomonadales bacterium]